MREDGRGMPKGIVFVAFIELAFNPQWEEIGKAIGQREAWLDTKMLDTYLNDDWMIFRAMRDAELWVIEPEATKKRILFKEKALVAVTNQMIRYRDEDVEDIIGIDEKAQMGRKDPKA